MSMTEELRSRKDWWFACVDIDVIRDKTLSQSAKFVFTVLCTFVTVNNRGCWPSNDAVAEAAGVSVPTVKRAYAELEARGIIERSARYNQGEGQTSSYTKIIGHNAECYDGQDTPGSPMNTPQLTDELPPGSPVSYKGNQENNIYYSNEGSPLPDYVPRPLPGDIYSSDDAPDIMKPTAELLLLKTGRKNLAWEEILALRELSASQMPARVQKEIERACERFQRQGKPLSSLRFEYIASALRNQPTRGKRKPKTSKPAEIPACSDAQAEAEMARIAELQAKFDEEAKIR